MATLAILKILRTTFNSEEYHDSMAAFGLVGTLKILQKHPGIIMIILLQKLSVHKMATKMAKTVTKYPL